MFVCYSSIHGQVSTTVLFPILGLFGARDCHLLYHDLLRQEEKRCRKALHNGASVDITSARHRTGQLTDSPEMVQGISGTAHAWPTRVQWHTKTNHGVSHLLQTEAGFEDFKQLYMPNTLYQILSLSQLVEAGYVSHFRPSAQKKLAHYPVQETDHRSSS